MVGLLVRGVVVLAAVLWGVGVAADWAWALAAQDALTASITWAVMAGGALLSQVLFEPFIENLKESIAQ